MDRTPKLQRKSSLSLSTRLNQKRHSASPQHRLKTSIANGPTNSRELNSNCEDLQRSPSVISISSDGGIECTPPHKKMAMSLDESLEFSPKIFDSSFSPTCLLSQTLAIDSPEVGWKWNRYSATGCDTNCNENTSVRTPDSAYAADSSFASAGSSTNEIAGKVSDSHKRRNANEARRDQRKILEQEYRRVEKTRAEEKLKQRCAKLQEQLKSAGTQGFKANDQSFEESSKIVPNNSLDNIEVKNQSTACTMNNAIQKFHPTEKLKNPELYSEFYNDSDSDCFLLEATQEIESKIESKTQPALTSFTNTRPKTNTCFESTSLPHVYSAPTCKTTPPNTKTIDPIENASFPTRENNKRSSFYMKFLEDDCTDDWFISLDEAILQTSQNKKPRTPLQRYKSMPLATAINSNATLNNNNNCVINSNTTSLKHLKVLSENTEASSSTPSKIKRHSSTHTLNPAGTSYRSRRQL